MWAMAAQAPGAPLACAAGEVDLARDSLANPGRIFRIANLAHEFMARSAGESVVAALQFQVSGADSRSQQPDACEAFRNPRERLLANFYAACLKLHSDHGLKLKDMAFAMQSPRQAKFAAELICFRSGVPRAV